MELAKLLFSGAMAPLNSSFASSIAVAPFGPCW